MKPESIRPLLLAVGLLFGFEISAATVRVSIKNGMIFDPAKPVIQVGDTVEFVNETTFPHTVTADPALAKNPSNVILPSGAAPFHSGPMALNAKFSHTFTKAGNYRYVCLPHELMGMAGEIIVEQTHQVACDVNYSLDGNVIEPKMTFKGVVPAKGGIAISEDFELDKVTANLHVYYQPNDFASVNYFHEATDTYLNADVSVRPGGNVSLNGRTRQIANTLNNVNVNCRFQ